MIREVFFSGRLADIGCFAGSVDQKSGDAAGKIKADRDRQGAVSALTRDPGIARLASYLARPEIGLEPVVTTFREVFLGD